MSAERPPFFHRDRQWYLGNDGARGPWDPAACHAGPVAGAFVRELEGCNDDQQLVRLTTNFVRPVPMDGFEITAKILRKGRSTGEASAVLKGRDGKTCASASALFMARLMQNDIATTKLPCPDFQNAARGTFPVKRAMHGKRFFGSEIDIRYPPGQTAEPGPTTIWMRTPGLLDGEPTSPFQLVCPIADCGNGIARNADFSAVTFLNPDLTVTLFRLPDSEWIASDAVSFWESTGIGMSQATLFDTNGAIGAATQSLLIRPLPV